MNQVNLCGNLVEDVKSKVSNDGIKIVSGTVAIQRPFSKKKESDFIAFSVIGNNADYVEKKGAKGSRVEISGSWIHNSWKDSDGNWHTQDYCRVNEITIIGKQTISTEKSSKDIADDDLPF